jgi:hypothetical protein
MHSYQLYSRKLNFFEKLTHASYSQLFLVWLVLNIAFAAVYFTLNMVLPAHGPTLPAGLSVAERLFDSFYFSVVTATSTGYGDILPEGFSKILAMTQCIMALLVFAVLVGKLVSSRQDVMLHEVHRMSFEGVFYHIRHVLFIVRNDFDRLIHKAKTHKQLQPEDWDMLGTAYLQAHSLIEEIPDLYNGSAVDRLHINLDREKLLFEAVHRTLMRTNALISVMNEVKIEWKTHAASTKELRRFIDMIDAVMPLWRERSPFHVEEEFQRILNVSAELHKDLRKAMAY